MAGKYLAQGASLKVSISSVFTVVPNCKKIAPPDDSLDMWDATTLDSTDIEKQPTGTIDPDKVAADLLFDSKDSTHAFLMTAKYAKTLQQFKITGPTSDPYNYAFSAYVTKFQTISETMKGQEGNLELSLKSVATYTAAP